VTDISFSYPFSNCLQ